MKGALKAFVYIISFAATFFYLSKFYCDAILFLSTDETFNFKNYFVWSVGWMMLVWFVGMLIGPFIHFYKETQFGEKWFLLMMMPFFIILWIFLWIFIPSFFLPLYITEKFPKYFN